MHEKPNNISTRFNSLAASFYLDTAFLYKPIENTMNFYAVIVDDDLEHSPVVRLIATGPTTASIQYTTDFNPYATYSKVLKSNFTIAQIQPLVLKTTFNGQIVNAHICACMAH